MPYCKFLTQNAFSEFLIQNEVLEQIFCESPHPELIKRSLTILYLRANYRNNPINDSLVEHIWTCCIEKHEAVSRAAFAVL
jgi:hypothetical protein